MKHQKEISYQLDLFSEQTKEDILQSASREDVNGTSPVLEEQVKLATKRRRALAGDLIGVVCSRENLHRAFKRVKKNKGVAGVDQVPVGEFAGWYAKEGDQLQNKLLSGDYHPMPVCTAIISKPNGGTRQLGIPTVKDRVIQQAIQQVLTPIYENEFSNHSYGFRPKRNAWQALEKASRYVSGGRNIVVDMDMENFFR